MLCKKPYKDGIFEYGCGQCMLCRINRRRLWAHRLMLESTQHEFSSFWTFTYDDAHLPTNGSLIPRDGQLFLKRLRFALEEKGRSLRFYWVGEYGDLTFRPHYHACFFGVSNLEAPWMAQMWNAGFVQGLSLSPQLAAYLCGYVTKKMTKKDDGRLGGKYPEYARMSLKPGIGMPAMLKLAEDLQEKTGSLVIAREGDVPLSLNGFGKRKQPLGRYLRRKLREELGIDAEYAKELWSLRQRETLLEEIEAQGGVAKALAERKRVSQVRCVQLEGKSKLFESGKRRPL